VAGAVALAAKDTDGPIHEDPFTRTGPRSTSTSGSSSDVRVDSPNGCSGSNRETMNAAESGGGAGIWARPSIPRNARVQYDTGSRICGTSAAGA
jgi:hypothetical protein